MRGVVCVYFSGECPPLFPLVVFSELPVVISSSRYLFWDDRTIHGTKLLDKKLFNY